jgi:hypothetical protein
VAALVVLANMLVFAAFTAGRSLAMGRCAPGREATDLAAFLSLEGVAFLLIAAAANAGISRIGLAPVLAVAGLVSTAGLLLALRTERAGRANRPMEATG